MGRRNRLSLQLIRDAIQKRGYFKFVVEGVSMFPFLIPGDELLIESVKIKEIKVGDIIIYSRGVALIVHRVKKILQPSNRTIFITQGDNLPFEDPPVEEEEILGKVKTLIRAKNRFNPPSLRPEVIFMVRWLLNVLRRLKKRLNLSIKQKDIIRYLRGDLKIRG